MSNKEYLKDILHQKLPPTSEYNTGWIVSNCNRTKGATKRWKLTQEIFCKMYRLIS